MVTLSGSDSTIFLTMQSCKRKALRDLTNTENDVKEPPISRPNVASANLLFPICSTKSSEFDIQTFDEDRYQNVHPLFSWYKYDKVTDHMSYDQFMNLMMEENDTQLITLLQNIGCISVSKQCLYCGGQMRMIKQGPHWFWICTRRVNGVKCNRGKASIRKGTIFDNSQLSTQCILSIIWHFVHRLTEKQCAEYTGLSTKNNTTIVKWYKFCRNVCTDWFWKTENTPKLGGFGKIVEMDESYFAGKPKFNRGRLLGENPKNTWKDDEKWGFGMTERGSLDGIIIQVPSNRSRRSLLPIIEKHCLDGTIFCSDGWKAYNRLKEHLDLEDVLHFPVNHSENFVDPITGSHTQTIEGLWRHAKEFLPSFGMKPSDLNTYIGAFLWHRYCKQRKLDFFMHFLKCAAEIHPIMQVTLPTAVCMSINVSATNNDDDFMI